MVAAGVNVHGGFVETGIAVIHLQHFEQSRQMVPSQHPRISGPYADLAVARQLFVQRLENRREEVVAGRLEVIDDLGHIVGLRNHLLTLSFLVIGGTALS